MAIGELQLSNALTAAGGPGALPRMMLSAELAPIFKDEACWAELCDFAAAVDETHQLSEEFSREFRAGGSVKSALQDNYILGAIAAAKLGLLTEKPVVAWAASNKHEFQGLTDGKTAEIAVMRFLHWAGADVSIADELTMTPLHYMAHVKYGQGCHLGAVRWLLDCGANANAKNNNGDTPMTYLCGVSIWNDALRETFLMLLQAGCDPTEVSADGSTPLGLLRLAEKSNPHLRRQALIDALDIDLSRPKPGFFTRLVGAGNERAWTATLAH